MVTVSTRPASSSSVMLAVRSELSSGTNNVSRNLEGVRGAVVLSSVRFPVSPPIPFELDTASAGGQWISTESSFREFNGHRGSLSYNSRAPPC